MSQQLALSSLFSVLALASLCIAVGSGKVGPQDTDVVPVAPVGIQAEIAPGLDF